MQKIRLSFHTIISKVVLMAGQHSKDPKLPIAKTFNANWQLLSENERNFWLFLPRINGKTFHVNFGYLFPIFLHNTVDSCQHDVMWHGLRIQSVFQNIFTFCAEKYENTEKNWTTGKIVSSLIWKEISELDFLEHI